MPVERGQIMLSMRVLLLQAGCCQYEVAIKVVGLRPGAFRWRLRANLLSAGDKRRRETLGSPLSEVDHPESGVRSREEIRIVALRGHRSSLPRERNLCPREGNGIGSLKIAREQPLLHDRRVVVDVIVSSPWTRPRPRWSSPVMQCEISRGICGNRGVIPADLLLQREIRREEIKHTRRE